MTVAAEDSSGSLVPLPPAREIPATFYASLRSWWVIYILIVDDLT